MLFLLMYQTFQSLNRIKSYNNPADVIKGMDIFINASSGLGLATNIFVIHTTIPDNK